MVSGLIYCFSNVHMPGVCLVSVTFQSLDELIEYANENILPYVLEFSKKVTDPVGKIDNIHTTLVKFGIENENGVFFTTSPEKVKALFDLIDPDPEIKMYPLFDTVTTKQKTTMGTLHICKDGCRVRHIVKCEHGVSKWYGTYKSNIIGEESPGIVLDGIIYKSFRNFTNAHRDECGENNPGYKMTGCSVKYTEDGPWTVVPWSWYDRL
jgi:hypothetical protein